MQTGKALVSIALIGMCGCRVDSNKNGNSEDVKISTPFGGMQVKTNSDAAQLGIGLAVYPGAQPVEREKNNSGSADVNMSFGSFQLRVKAANYRTPDARDKVEAFYRDGLKKYGEVIACKGNNPVGTPTRTADGLTCDAEKDNHVTVLELSGEKLELKAGSKLHQHVVTLDSDGGGTKFELVALDLPGKSFLNGDKDTGQ